MAQRQPAQPLDRDEFLASVKMRLDNGAATYHEAVDKVIARRPLDPALESEALMVGLVALTAETWGTLYRKNLIRSRPVRVARSQVGESVVRQISVTRSAARDWPVYTPTGRKTLEFCTVEEAETSIDHITATIEGMIKSRAAVEAAVNAAREAGVAVIGELPDDVLDACLEEGQ